MYIYLCVCVRVCVQAYTYRSIHLPKIPKIIVLHLCA